MLLQQLGSSEEHSAVARSVLADLLKKSLFGVTKKKNP